MLHVVFVQENTDLPKLHECISGTVNARFSCPSCRQTVPGTIDILRVVMTPEARVYAYTFGRDSRLSICRRGCVEAAGPSARPFYSAGAVASKRLWFAWDGIAALIG